MSIISTTGMVRRRSHHWACMGDIKCQYFLDGYLTGLNNIIIIGVRDQNTLIIFKQTQCGEYKCNIRIVVQERYLDLKGTRLYNPIISIYMNMVAATCEPSSFNQTCNNTLILL